MTIAQTQPRPQHAYSRPAMGVRQALFTSLLDIKNVLASLTPSRAMAAYTSYELRTTASKGALPSSEFVASFNDFSPVEEKLLKLIRQIPGDCDVRALERKIISLMPRKLRAGAIATAVEQSGDDESYLVNLARRIAVTDAEELERKILSLTPAADLPPPDTRGSVCIVTRRPIANVTRGPRMAKALVDAGYRVVFVSTGPPVDELRQMCPEVEYLVGSYIGFTYRVADRLRDRRKAWLARRDAPRQRWLERLRDTLQAALAQLNGHIRAWLEKFREFREALWYRFGRLKERCLAWIERLSEALHIWVVQLRERWRVRFERLRGGAIERLEQMMEGGLERLEDRRLARLDLQRQLAAARFAARAGRAVAEAATGANTLDIILAELALPAASRVLDIGGAVQGGQDTTSFLFGAFESPIDAVNHLRVKRPALAQPFGERVRMLDAMPDAAATYDLVLQCQIVAKTVSDVRVFAEHHSHLVAPGGYLICHGLLPDRVGNSDSPQPPATLLSDYSAAFTVSDSGELQLPAFLAEYRPVAIFPRKNRSWSYLGWYVLQKRDARVTRAVATKKLFYLPQEAPIRPLRKTPAAARRKEPASPQREGPGGQSTQAGITVGRNEDGRDEDGGRNADVASAGRWRALAHRVSRRAFVATSAFLLKKDSQTHEQVRRELEPLDRFDIAGKLIWTLNQWAASHAFAVNAERLTAGRHFDIVHVWDNYGLVAGARVARRARAKMVYDAVEIVTDRLAQDLNVIEKLRERLERREEARIFRKALGMTGTGDALAGWYVTRYRIPKPLVVRNCRYYWDYRQDGRLRRDIGVAPDTRLLLWCGSAYPQQGIEVALRALPHLPSHVHLAVVTDVSHAWKKYVGEELPAIAVSLGVADRFHILPEREPNDLVPYISDGDIGFVLSVPVNHPNQYYNLPNKFFEYIMARMPVGTLAFPEVSNIVNKYRIGSVLDEHDSVKNAELILQMLQPDTYATLKANVMKAARELCWENESRPYVDLIDSLMPAQQRESARMLRDAPKNASAGPVTRPRIYASVGSE